MMKKIRHTEEEIKERYTFAKQYLDDKFYGINEPKIYVLTAKEGHGLQKHLRFFIVADNEIEDITVKVADITGFPLYDRYQYFAIYTNRSNMLDIVQSISENLYGNVNEIVMERL